MDQNFDFNPRNRRRSNLGRRKIGENAPRLAPVFPTNPIQSIRGLGRSRSVKKTPTQLCKPSRGYVVKKKLFIKSPSDLIGTSAPQEQGESYSRMTFNSPIDPSPSYLNDTSLNLTGMQVIKMPSFDYNSTIPKIHSLTSRYDCQTTVPKSSVGNYSFFDMLEPPKSPGPSRYNQVILEELADLKPPVDPGENVHLMRLLSLKNEPSTSSSATGPSTSNEHNESAASLLSRTSATFSPHLSSTCIGNISPGSDIKTKSNLVSTSKLKGSDKKLSVICEDLDTTDTFLLAEQTIIDQNQTIIATATQSKNINVTSRCSEPVLQKAYDIELDQAIEEIDQGLEDMNRVMKRMVNLKKSIQSLISKRQKLKNEVKVENKENIPTNLSKEIKTKWIDDLKSDNPGLLKTPKPVKNSKSRMSVADQSAIWTPHSLSTVLQEQIGDLFE